MSEPGTMPQGTVFTDEDDTESLEREIESALRDGVRMTPSQVFSLWKYFDDLPGIQTRLVWLEVGRQEFNQDGTFGDGGCGWIHILAKHLNDFERKGVDSSQIFNKISQSLLSEEYYSMEGLDLGKFRIMFLESSETRPFLIAVALGTNGYLVTAWPESLPSRSVNTNHKRKRMPAGSDTTLTTKEEIERQETGAAFLVSQHFGNTLMYKQAGENQYFEYIWTKDLFDESLVVELRRFSNSCYQFVHGDKPVPHRERLAHDLAGLRLALQVKSTSGLATYYEFVTMNYEIHAVRSAVSKPFLRQFHDDPLGKQIRRMRFNDTPTCSPARKKFRPRGDSLSATSEIIDSQ